MSMISAISLPRLYLAGDKMVARLSGSAKEMKALVLILDHSYRGLVRHESRQLDDITYNAYLREYDSPLERRAMQVLALSTVTMLCVYWVSVELKYDVTTPTLTIKSTFQKESCVDNTAFTDLVYFATNLSPSLSQVYGGLFRKSSSLSPPF